MWDTCQFKSDTDILSKIIWREKKEARAQQCDIYGLILYYEILIFNYLNVSFRWRMLTFVCNTRGRWKATYKKVVVQMKRRRDRQYKKGEYTERKRNKCKGYWKTLSHMEKYNTSCLNLSVSCQSCVGLWYTIAQDDLVPGDIMVLTLQ